MIRKDSFLYRLIAIPGIVLIRVFEAAVRLARGDAVFHDPGAFPWVNALEARSPAIRAELLRVLESRETIPNFQDVSEEQERITHGDTWKSFLFYAYGHRLAGNCARCPDTTRALEAIPGMTTAMFSILASGAHIAPHRGPYKGVLRCHLALLVPTDRESCAIRVAGEVRTWEEGRCLLFDDTHDHEAWNRSGELRVVLFIDVLRDLPFPLSAWNRLMVRLIGASPFVQNVLENVNRWNRRVSDVHAGA